MTSRKRKFIRDVSKRHFRRLLCNINKQQLVSLKACDEPVNTNYWSSTSNNFSDEWIENDLCNNVASNITESYPAGYNGDTVEPHEKQNDNETTNINITANKFTESHLAGHSGDIIGSHENQSNNNMIDEMHHVLNDHEKREDNTVSLNIELRYWATNHKIKRGAISDLLTVLRKYNIEANLPKDYRTLLKTPRSTEIKPLLPGEYYHFSITSEILQVLDLEYSNYNFKEICLKVGIDGLPISNSNSSQLWPILGCIHPTSRIFLIGVYHGYSKPADSNKFLENFVEDISELINKGLVYKDITLEVSVYCLVADAPAKSFITKTKGHTGYFSCTKCEQEGTYIDGRMSFPSISSRKRTKDSFITQENSEYHLGIPLLLNIPGFDIVADIPIDYMHLVCIGVVKKLITLWIKGPLHVRLPGAKIDIISRNLLALKPFIPKEFARKPQEISNYSSWKATELRQFLLYTGPIVLFKVLPPNIYNHFVTLHVAIRIFCSEFHTDASQLEYAHELMQHFIESFILYYGEQFVSHNVHGLIHLKDDVERFGHLDSFSAFPFENFMKTLKSFILKPEQPLQQIHRRYTEMQISGSKKGEGNRVITSENAYHTDGPLVSGLRFLEQLRYIQSPKWFLSIKMPDNCCIVNETVVEIHNIVNKDNNSYAIIGKRYLTVTDIYKIPCPSSYVSCSYVENLSEIFEMWSIPQITAKCLSIPYLRGFAVFPLLHN